MDKKQAENIAASPVMGNVTYKGVPVYIESIDNNSFTASIHPLDQPNNSKKVNISNLIQNWS